MLLFHSPLEVCYLNKVYRRKDKSLKKVLEWLKDLKCTQNFATLPQITVLSCHSPTYIRVCIQALNKHFNVFFMVSNHIYSDVAVKLELTVVVDKCHPSIPFISQVKHFSKL